MSSRDDEQTELLRQIREQLATLHEALSLATDVLAQGVDALATSVDETNVRVDEVHAKLDTVTRQTHDYIARLDRNAVRANRQRLDLALEPLDLGPIEEFVRSSDEPDGRTPDSASLSSRIDETNASLKDFKQQTHENFGRATTSACTRGSR